MSPCRCVASAAVVWLTVIFPRSAHAVPQSDTVPFRIISAGATHTCALATSGEAYCWGDNQEGELGTGSKIDSPVPTAVTGGTRFLTIEAAVEFTCGLATTGEAYCWGRNDTYALGNAAMERSFSPVLVTGGLLFRALATGADHTCGIAVDGAAYCWGANGSGQLGTGDTLPSPLPLPVAGSHRFLTITAGDDHTCAISVDSLAFCWGSNRRGQLGVNHRDGGLRPEEVAHHRHWRLLTAGARHTCGIVAGDRAVAYCWGDNFHNESVPRGRRTLWAPTFVTDGRYLASVEAGRWHTCYLWRRGFDTVTCVGANFDDQLGRNLFGVFVAVSPGDAHTCALRKDGTAECWGRNSAGQLGDGTHLRQQRPVHVAAPAAPEPS
jgi:alpha-tubulin suppressor-like RCC1 family protein